jgi:hypothetical protein
MVAQARHVSGPLSATNSITVAMLPSYSIRFSYPVPMRAVSRAHVEALEREIQKLPQVDCPVWHHFAPGLYARKMLIRKGVTLTGAVHKTEHLVTVSGDISVTTDEGVARITDPHFIFASKPGAKRAGYAHEDTFFTTVHATDETDLDRLVEELTESSADEIMGGTGNVQMLAQLDREDYGRFLDEYGLTQELVTILVENMTDQVPMPTGFDTLDIRPSPIAGVGMFATRDIADGELIAPARLGDMRTPAGRYINHSCLPNCVFVPHANGNLDLHAARAIQSGEEITIDYRQAARVNGAGLRPLKERV